MIIKLLFWLFIGFIDGIIIFWWVISPIELRKACMELYVMTVAKYGHDKIFERQIGESDKDYYKRLKVGYLLSNLYNFKEGE